MSWASDNREKIRQQQKARHLFVNKGLKQKEVARIVGISEKTFVSWSKKYGWKTQSIAYRMNANKKEQAFKLVVLAGITQKEASKRLGLSERTIHTWRKESNWDSLSQNVLAKTKGLLFLFIGYIKFVKVHCPEISFLAESLLHEYLLSNEDFEDKQ